MSDKYDVIVVGSGIGGLTCGAFLSKAGMRVLVLEKHTKIGGYAHSFKRKKYLFESGIHSVSMSSSGFINHLLTLLGIENTMQTIEYPEMFSVATPFFSMSLPSRKNEIYESLQEKFPDQKDNINQLFHQAHLFYDNIITPMFDYEENFSGENTQFVSKFHNRSYNDFISSIITNNSLRQLIFGQWPYVGTSPGYAPCLFNFMMFLVHLLEGSHCCKEGFHVLASKLASVITSRNGSVLTKKQVKRLVIENKMIKRVITDRGEDFEAPVIVSNISPYIVHNQLIDKKARSRRWQRRLKNLRPSVSSVIVYLGMKNAIDQLIPHNIHFWYTSSDYQRIFSNILDNKKPAIDHLIFLKSIKYEYKTLTLMNFVQKSFTHDWKSEKMRIAEKLINKAENIFPGFKSLIDLVEVGSPETFERYTGNTDGALYGFENTKSMYGEAKMPIFTHITNLFQTGHWGKPGCSIWNVMANAYTVSKTILSSK